MDGITAVVTTISIITTPAILECVTDGTAETIATITTTEFATAQPVLL
jgi:hypothetical protein